MLLVRFRLPQPLNTSTMNTKFLSTPLPALLCSQLAAVTTIHTQHDKPNPFSFYNTTSCIERFIQPRMSDVAYHPNRFFLTPA